MDIAIKSGLAEARLLAGEHWRALLVYAALGVLLPFLLLASEPIFSLRNIIAITTSPWAFQFSGSITGPLYLLGIVSIIAAGAMLAAWNALLAEMREGYISEMMYGMVAGFAYLVANILLYTLVAAVLIVPMILAIGLAEWTALPPAVVAIRQLLLSVLGSWLAARFCLVGPVMGAGGRLEPFSAYIESWRRTGSAQGRLFGFYLVYSFIFGVLAAALTLLHGAVIVASDPGSVTERLMSAGWVLLLGAYFVGQLVIPAGFYRASQPGATASEVFA